MKKWGATGILITILMILTLLGAINYFTTPFKKWQMANEQAEVVLPQIVDIAEDGNNDLPSRMTFQLSPRELVWQVLAVPVEVDDRLIQRNSVSANQGITSGLASVQTIVNSQLGKSTQSGVLSQSDNQDSLKSELMSNLPATAPGALIIFGEQISMESAKQLAQVVDNTYSTSQHKVWLGTDHEGGLVQRLSGQGFTSLPSWQKICQSSPSAQINLANSTALELSMVGIDLVLAPMVDVATQSGVLGSRVCSGNPELVASVSASFISSYLQVGILPFIKHYPGIGGVTVDLHNQFASSAIQPIDVLPFHQLLTQFPMLGVMTTHLGPEKNSTLICSRSYSCVSELTGLYPKAIVISDALDMKSAVYNPDTLKYDTPLPQVALEAMLAGNDLLLFGPSVSQEEINEVATFLEFAADRDPAIKERLELAAEKILSYKGLNNHEK